VTKKLTLDELKEMRPEQIIKKGEGFYPKLWGRGDVKWFAVKGEKGDWYMYYHTVHHEFGRKLCNEKIIRKLVPCTDEAWAMYRL